MRARFIGGGDPTENAVCVVFGQSFPMGQWTDVPKDVVVRLNGNPTFEVDADEDGSADPSVEEMRAILREHGVKFHPKTGAARLAELIKAHVHG